MCRTGAQGRKESIAPGTDQSFSPFLIKLEQLPNVYHVGDFCLYFGPEKSLWAKNLMWFQLCTTCSKVLSVSLSCSSYRTRPLIFPFFGGNIKYCQRGTRWKTKLLSRFFFFAIFCIFFPRNHLHNKTRNYLSGLLLDLTYTHKHVSESKEM